MAKQLSERETAVLKTILEYNRYGSTGTDLVMGVRSLLGSISPYDVTPAGAHRTAASLCRKNLAWRTDGRPQSYKITGPGRRALNGDQGGQWIAHHA